MNKDSPAIEIKDDLEGILCSTKLDNRGFIEKVTDLYFRPKSFERSGKIYEAIGIRSVKRLIVESWKKYRRFWGMEKVESFDPYLLWDTSKKGLKKYNIVTKCIEGFHIGVIYICTSDIVNRISDGDVEKIILDGAGIIINTYLALLQRYNRARIYNVIDKIERREISTFK